MSAQTDQHSAFRRVGIVLFVLIVSAVFCFGLSSGALAEDTATTSHEEPTAEETGGTTDGTNEWHPEAEPTEHPEEHPEEPTDGHTDGEEPEEEPDPHPEEPADCEDESDDETEAETADDDEECEDESDDDDECEIPGVNDGGDDRADDDEDDTDCVTVEEPGDEEETEVLGTSTKRPALAATGFGPLALSVAGGGMILAGVAMRGRRSLDGA